MRKRYFYDDFDADDDECDFEDDDDDFDDYDDYDDDEDEDDDDDCAPTCGVMMRCNSRWGRRSRMSCCCG